MRVETSFLARALGNKCPYCYEPVGGSHLHNCEIATGEVPNPQNFRSAMPRIHKVRLTIIKIDEQFAAMRQETLPHVEANLEFIGEHGEVLETRKWGGFVPDTLEINLRGNHGS